VAAHYTYTEPRDVYKPAVRVDRRHPGWLAGPSEAPHLDQSCSSESSARGGT
jgi:hypothetical protein